jgi:uncharacterized phage protein gp47/JayE
VISMPVNYPGYVSQQSTILASMITFLQTPTNWPPDNVPKITDFTPGSIVYTLLASVSTAVDMVSYAVWVAQQAAYLSTAVGTDLDYKAGDYGIPRKPALAATGTFTFGKNASAYTATDIPAGTLISTVPGSGGDVITFSTTQDCSLPAGQTSVGDIAACQIAGSSGNVAADTQLLISSAVPGIDTVVLTVSIVNGIDAESDDALRARALASFMALATGTIGWYQQTVLDVVGVSSAIPVPQNRGAGTVDVFFVGPGNTIPSSQLQSAVQAAINAGRPCTDDALEQVPTILTINATLTIHVLARYDPVATKAAVQAAVASYINNLGVGAQPMGYVYGFQLCQAAASVPGVVNVNATTPIFTDTAVTSSQLPQAGTITVNTV